MNFAERIAEYRKSLNWTQEMLADRCSVTRQAVAKWEKGDSMPDIYTIAKMAKLFSTSIEELISTDDAVAESDDFYIRLIKDGDQEIICEMVKERREWMTVIKALNDFGINEGGIPEGDRRAIDFFYRESEPEGVYLLFRRSDNAALGMFDVRWLAEEGEMSMYIRRGFEMDMTVLKDFSARLKTKYNVRVATVSCSGGQEEDILMSLGYPAGDGKCAVGLPFA